FSFPTAWAVPTTPPGSSEGCTLRSPRPGELRRFSMKRVQWLGVFVAVLLAIPAFAAAAEPDFFAGGAQAFPETVGTPRDPGARAAEMQGLQQRLAFGQVEKALGQALVLQLTPAERTRIDAPGRVESKYLVGLAKPVGTVLDFSAARGLGKRTAGLAWGTARGTGSDGFTWTAAVEVPGATALRLHLEGVDL